MKFVTENIVLISVAIISGVMLFWPMVSRRLMGATLDHLAATRMVNDQDALLLDVRLNAEFVAGHLPRARNIPQADVAKRAAELPADKPVIVYCNSSQQAAKAAASLRDQGREQVFVLDGGLQGWRQAGLPVVK